VTVHLRDLIKVLESAYPPELAQDWDAVGLVCGDPADEVHTVLLAVDATDCCCAGSPESARTPRKGHCCTG
jgi:putative NIF3 family GTP cyclohydrolase 1 type 2